MDFPGSLFEGGGHIVRGRVADQLFDQKMLSSSVNGREGGRGKAEGIPTAAREGCCRRAGSVSNHLLRKKYEEREREKKGKLLSLLAPRGNLGHGSS